MAYHRCIGCGLERRDPLPTLDELASYYEGGYRDGLYAVFVKAESMKRATAQWRLRALRPFVESGRCLDIGCADGMFALEAARVGFEAQGLDLSSVAVAKAQSRGVSAMVGTIDVLPPGPQFDLITMFDVLEHTLAPRETLAAVVDRLQPGGTLALSVPNLESVSRRVMGRHWYFYIPDEHMHLFTPLSLQLLLESVGLKRLGRVVARKPMTLAYSMTQFEEYNPLIFRLFNPFVRRLPGLRDMIVPLPIGELLVIGRKP